MPCDLFHLSPIAEGEFAPGGADEKLFDKVSGESVLSFKQLQLQPHFIFDNFAAGQLSGAVNGLSPSVSMGSVRTNKRISAPKSSDGIVKLQRKSLIISRYSLCPYASNSVITLPPNWLSCL